MSTIRGTGVILAMLFAPAALASGVSATAIVNGVVNRNDSGTPGNFKDDSASVDYIHFKSLNAMQVTIDVLSWEVDERFGSPTFGDPIDVNANGRFAFMDTQVFLFRDDGVLGADDLFAPNDDDDTNSGGKDGSISPKDSYISTFLPVGDYILAVSSFSLSLSEALAGVNELEVKEGPLSLNGDEVVQSGFADYRVSFEGDVALTQSAVPLPPGVLLGVAGFAGVITRRVTRR